MRAALEGCLSAAAREPGTCLWDRRAYSSLRNGHRIPNGSNRTLEVTGTGWLCSVPPNGDMSTTRLSSAGASTSFVLQTLLCSSCHVDHLFFKTSFFPTLVNVLECFHHLRRKLASSGSGCICSVFPFRFSFFSGSPLFLLLHSLPNSSLSALLKEP